MSDQPRLQPDLPLDALLQQAAESQPLLQQQADALLERLRAKNPELFAGVTFEMAPLKDAEDAAKKVATDYNGNPREIKDLVRGRFVVDNPEQIAAIKDAIRAEMSVDTMKDKYQDPSSTGYRDINTKVQLENGHIAEIQVQHRAMLAVNKPTHELREQAEKIRETAMAEGRAFTPDEQLKIQQLNEQARALNNRAAAEAGLDDLLSPNARAALPKPGIAGAVADTLGDIGRSNRNIIIDVGIGVAVGAGTLAAGASAAEAAGAAVDVVNPVPATTSAIRNGGGAAQIAEGAARDGSMLAGCAAGGAVGGKLGAAGGTLVTPGIGTAVGGVGGAVLGCIGGAWTAGTVTDSIINFFKGGDKVSLNDIRDILPDTVTPDMPPEFAALVEVQNSDVLLQRALDDLQDQGSFEGMVAELEHQSELYQQAEQQKPQLAAQQPLPQQYEQPLPRQMTSNFG